MGNRAVLALDSAAQNAIGIYVHWNGGRASVEGFLEATRRIMGDRLGDQTYGKARLIQAITTFHEGNLSVGVGLLKQLDCDNWDNGVYVIDTATMTIKDRKYFKGLEQSGDPDSIADEIVSAINAA